MYPDMCRKEGTLWQGTLKRSVGFLIGPAGLARKLKLRISFLFLFYFLLIVEPGYLEVGCRFGFKFVA